MWMLLVFDFCYLCYLWCQANTDLIRGVWKGFSPLHCLEEIVPSRIGVILS